MSLRYQTFGRLAAPALLAGALSTADARGAAAFEEVYETGKASYSCMKSTVTHAYTDLADLRGRLEHLVQDTVPEYWDKVQEGFGRLEGATNGIVRINEDGDVKISAKQCVLSCAKEVDIPGPSKNLAQFLKNDFEEDVYAPVKKLVQHMNAEKGGNFLQAEELRTHILRSIQEHIKSWELIDKETFREHFTTLRTFIDSEDWNAAKKHLGSLGVRLEDLTG